MSGAVSCYGDHGALLGFSITLGGSRHLRFCFPTANVLLHCLILPLLGITIRVVYVHICGEVQDAEETDYYH